LDPNYELAYLNRGVVFSKMKNYENALNDFKQVISLNTNNILSYKNCGIIEEKLGNYERAVEYYEKYLKQNPTDMNVKKWLLDLKNKGY